MAGTEERRAKVKAFYDAYAKTDEERAKMENAVNAKMPDDALFKMLREKYKLGPECTDPIAYGKPGPAAASSAGAGGSDERRARVTAFYQKYAPSEIAKVENAMKYKGADSELFSMLREKYKLEDSTDPIALGQAAPASGGSGGAMRDRVKAFYEKYAPQDLHRLDKTMALGLPEDDLIGRLKQKYNITDDAPAAAAASKPAAAAGGGSGSGDTMRDRVKAFYEKHAPQDLHRLDKTMTLGLSEEDLIARLKQKYNVTGDASPAAANLSLSVTTSAAGSGSGAGGAGDTMRDRVKAFYETHAPQDLHRLEKTLALGLPEDDLIGRLKQKYNVRDDAMAASTRNRASSTAPVTPPAGGVSGSSGDAMRDRVKAFYEKHAPQDLHRLDKTMTLGLSEEDLITRLKQKYGVADDAASATTTASTAQTTTATTATGDDSGKRERIKAFYTKHAPQDLHRLDKTLSMAVPEEELLAKLRQKYNVVSGESSAATAAAAAPSSSSTATAAAAEEALKSVIPRQTTAAATANSTPDVSKPTTPRVTAPAIRNMQAVPEMSLSPCEVHLPVQSNHHHDHQYPTPASAPDLHRGGGTGGGYDLSPESSNINFHFDSMSFAPASGKQRPIPLSAEMQHQQHQQQQQQRPYDGSSHDDSQSQRGQHQQIINVPPLQHPSAVNHYVSSFMQGQSARIQDLLFTLQQREDAVGLREAAVAARETAFESRCLSMGAEPTRLIFDAAGQQSAEFVAHLVDVEATLAAATADLVRFEKLLRQQERDLSDRNLAVLKREEVSRADESERQRRLEERSRELKLQHDRAAEEQAACEAERRRLTNLAAELARKESELARREAMAAAQMELSNQRGAQIEVQQEATAKEREASRRFSEELLQREGTVRAVERSLNAARAELTRLENDVALHAKKLLEDQRALRRWSEELERREERFNKKNPSRG